MRENAQGQQARNNPYRRSSQQGAPVGRVAVARSAPQSRHQDSNPRRADSASVSRERVGPARRPATRWGTRPKQQH